MDISPSTETLVDIGISQEQNDNRILTEHEQLQISNKIKLENTWRSCCFLFDKRAVIFFSQFGISISIMGLCIYQLITHHDDCDSNQLYSGLLTMLIGIHLPTPKMRK
jgi:hypothetical protein